MVSDRRYSKGHFSEDYHVKLLDILKSILSDSIDVTVIGNGEFDGVVFLETIEEYAWSFVVRIAKNTPFHKNGTRISIPKKLKPGEFFSSSEVDFTNEFYGPVTVLVWRPDDKKEILYLISNCSSVQEIKRCYKKRQIIEIFFSDLKTKGFFLHKSHINDIGRLGNLMIAACITYIWVVILGEYALNKGLNMIFHRADRCDLSLLQLGFRYIEYWLNDGRPIPKINFLVETEFCVR